MICALVRYGSVVSMFTISVAGLPIAVDNKYREAERISSEYLTDEKPLFTVSAAESEIEEEFSLGMGVERDVCESVVLYRKIAEQIHKYGAMVFHGAVVVKDGAAYAVTARSGVGKTTHLRLWKSLFGDSVYILNGDKPIIRKIGEDIYISGTPWRGKEGYGRPGMLKLRGIAFLKRSETNSAERISAEEALDDFLAQIYIPKNMGAVSVLSLADTVLCRIPLIRLSVNMEKEAAAVALRAFENNN